MSEELKKLHQEVISLWAVILLVSVIWKSNDIVNFLLTGYCWVFIIAIPLAIVIAIGLARRYMVKGLPL